MFDLPIVINNFNRLTTTKKLAEDLDDLGYKNVHILDNASTYPPLLEWYTTCPFLLRELGSNVGNLAIYNSNYINEFQGWVAYSDSDIELPSSIPRDFIHRMVNLAEKYNVNKIGLALRIDDLPDTDYGNRVRGWEARFWHKELEKDVYEAEIDTTFCLIKVGLPFQYQAIRVGGDFTAKHTPWYLDYFNLTDEEKFVINASDSTYSTTKRYVDSVSL